MKPTPVNMGNCQNYVVIDACKNMTENNVFVDNMWPAKSALFIYVSTHCIETCK